MYTPMALVLTLALVSSFLSPALSTSRSAFSTQLDSETGFRVPLRHVDSGRNLTKFEFLKRAMKRGRKRAQKLYSMALAVSDPSIDAPVHAGSGEFLLQLSIGSPPVSYSAILDTGSDLIWTQCKPCQQCYKQPTPVFDPTESSSFKSLSCSSSLCKVLPLASCSSNNTCEYLYSYGDYSSTQGILATETFTFDNVSVKNVGFGCGLDNEGGGFDQGAGLVGMGRGPLSLISQLDEPKFSYCLTSVDSTKTSTLLMGSKANSKAVSDESNTTPLIKSSTQPTFYYINLEGITVGSKRLSIDKSTFALQSDGTGGMIIDSGTTITYLERSAFDALKDEFTKQLKLPVDNSTTTGLEQCYTLPVNTDNIDVPKLVLHFEGADLDLPGENYVIADSGSNVLCLAMGSSSGMSIFGNMQQQNMLVVHDLVKETLSFVPTECDKL